MNGPTSPASLRATFVSDREPGTNPASIQRIAVAAATTSPSVHTAKASWPRQPVCRSFIAANRRNEGDRTGSQTDLLPPPQRSAAYGDSANPRGETVTRWGRGRRLGGSRKRMAHAPTYAGRAVTPKTGKDAVSDRAGRRGRRRQGDASSRLNRLRSLPNHAAEPSVQTAIRGYPMRVEEAIQKLRQVRPRGPRAVVTQSNQPEVPCH